MNAVPGSIRATSGQCRRPEAKAPFVPAAGPSRPAAPAPEAMKIKPSSRTLRGDSRTEQLYAKAQSERGSAIPPLATSCGGNRAADGADGASVHSGPRQPSDLVVLLGENLLRREVGSTKIMSEQLRKAPGCKAGPDLVSSVVRPQSRLCAAQQALAVGGFAGGIVGSIARSIQQAGIATAFRGTDLSSSIGALVLSAILSGAGVVFSARKTDAQSFVTVEDFWGCSDRLSDWILGNDGVW